MPYPIFNATDGVKWNIFRMAFYLLSFDMELSHQRRWEDHSQPGVAIIFWVRITL